MASAIAADGRDTPSLPACLLPACLRRQAGRKQIRQAVAAIARPGNTPRQARYVLAALRAYARFFFDILRICGVLKTRATAVVSKKKKINKIRVL